MSQGNHSQKPRAGHPPLPATWSSRHRHPLPRWGSSRLLTATQLAKPGADPHRPLHPFTQVVTGEPQMYVVGSCWPERGQVMGRGRPDATPQLPRIHRVP